MWKSTPTVVVCEYAPINENQIKKAVTFWEKLGHRFFSTQYKYDPLGKCNQSNPTGYILVHLISNTIKMDPDALAETHFFVNNNTNEIEWATFIIIKSIT